MAVKSFRVATLCPDSTSATPRSAPGHERWPSLGQGWKSRIAASAGVLGGLGMATEPAPPGSAHVPPPPPPQAPVPAQAAAGQGDPELVKELLLCPISRAVMRDPVTTCDGHSYDRLAIEAWLARGHKRSPMTGSELQTRRLYPNVALKQLAAHLIPMTQEEEEERRRDRERQQEQQQRHDPPRSSAGRAVFWSDEDEEDEEGSGDESGSSSDDSDSSYASGGEGEGQDGGEEERGGRRVLRVVSLMPSPHRRRRTRPQRRQRQAMEGMVAGLLDEAY